MEQHSFIHLSKIFEKTNWMCTDKYLCCTVLILYRKVPKISHGAYIFQRLFLRGFFWRGLYSEGLIYRGKFAFQNRLGKPYSWKEIYLFCIVLLCIWGQFPSTRPRGALYFEGQFNGGFFALQVWGAYIWRGLYMEGLIFRILWYTYFFFCYQ